MYELQGECDAIRQGRVTSLVMETVRMASDEVVKADLLQRNSQLLLQQEKQHKLLCILSRRLAVFVTLESALENERSQMIELNRLAVSARNLCEEVLRGSSDRGNSALNSQQSAAAAEELGSRVLHQVLALDSRHRPSEFTPKRDVIALAERYGSQSRAATGSGAGTGNHCEAEVELCKAAAGALHAMLHNDFQQPELLPPDVRSLFSTAFPRAFCFCSQWAICFQVLKAYETLVAETDARFSEAEVVFKERQQQQHSFSRCLIAKLPQLVIGSCRRQVKSSGQEAAGAYGHVLHSAGSLCAGFHLPCLCDPLAGAAARVHVRFGAPSGC